LVNQLQLKYKDRPYNDQFKGIASIGRFLWDVLTELFYGAKSGRLPWTICCGVGLAITLSVVIGLDSYVWQKLAVDFMVVIQPPLFQIYFCFAAMLPFLSWGLYQAALKQRLLKRLTNVFTTSGLKNALGKYPQFIFDHAIDSHTRIMRLTRANLAKSKFDEAKESLESALQVYIDEIKEQRSHGTIDILYAHEPMPEVVALQTPVLRADHFIVGHGRSGPLETNFEDVPHILVAGQTGGGKSTFLRQLIVSLYVSNPKYSFTLADLKGGLEFQTFEKLSRVNVLSEPAIASVTLAGFEKELERRYELLKRVGCKDLAAYGKLSSEKRKGLPDVNRHVIVIDEVAELFLTGAITSSKESQIARRVCGKIARLGRAVGLHLIAGTQRPDARALDTQIKAQLTGKICFQMGDTASSMVVLSNGRARDLPGIPGRAIWQVGMRQIEVQVPFLSIEGADKILQSHRTETSTQNKPIVGHAAAQLVPKADEHMKADLL
jgi:hypothetical protein